MKIFSCFLKHERILQVVFIANNLRLLSVGDLLQAKYMKAWKAADNSKVSVQCRELLNRVGTAALLEKYSLRGAKGKLAFDQLPVCQLVAGKQVFFIHSFVLFRI